jgi:hypothetical protein
MWQKLHAPASERIADLWRLYLADRRKDGREVTRQEKPGSGSNRCSVIA